MQNTHTCVLKEHATASCTSPLNGCKARVASSVWMPTQRSATQRLPLVPPWQSSGRASSAKAASDKSPQGCRTLALHHLPSLPLPTAPLQPSPLPWHHHSSLSSATPDHRPGQHPAPRLRASLQLARAPERPSWRPAPAQCYPRTRQLWRLDPLSAVAVRPLAVLPLALTPEVVCRRGSD